MDEEFQIGEVIRTKRKELGLTLEVLASRAGVARTTISKVERDIISPSLGTLCKIARGMNVKLTSLIKEEEEENEVVVRNEKRKYLNLKGSRCMIGCFTKPRTNMEFEVVKLIIEAGGDSGMDPPHPGEEVIICLEGMVEFRIGEKKYSLHTGDSVHYKPISSSGLFNVSEQEAQVLWIFTPPQFLVPEDRF